MTGCGASESSSGERRSAREGGSSRDRWSNDRGRGDCDRRWPDYVELRFREGIRFGGCEVGVRGDEPAAGRVVRGCDGHDDLRTVARDWRGGAGGCGFGPLGGGGGGD